MDQEDHPRACCEVSQALAEEFAKAARHYAETVVLLTTQGLSDTAHARFSKLAREAQRRSDEAFVLYEEHLDCHRWVSGYLVGDVRVHSTHA